MRTGSPPSLSGPHGFPAEKPSRKSPGNQPSIGLISGGSSSTSMKVTKNCPIPSTTVAATYGVLSEEPWLHVHGQATVPHLASTIERLPNDSITSLPAGSG